MTIAFKYNALLGLAGVTTLLSACLFVGGGRRDDNDDGKGYLSSVTSGTGAQGGTGGTGGSGGTGGTGGSCTPAEGTGQTAVVCDELGITPYTQGGPAGLCGANADEEPLGYASCHKAFEIYRPGPAEDLAYCLSFVPTGEECNAEPVEDCVQQVYDRACEDAYVVDTCHGIADVCGADPFDTDACQLELKVFNSEGVNAVIDCMNTVDPNLTCQAAYNECFGQVTAL